MRVGCSPDIINKEGGPLVIAIFLRELNQALPVESGNKCVALLNFQSFFCLIFYLLWGLVYFRKINLWHMFKYRWTNLCVCVHLLGFFLILTKSFPLAQKVKVKFRFSRIYSLSANFAMGHITSKIAIWRKMCDILIDREKPINPIWFRKLRNILITFWRFPVVLIYLINSYGDIWLSTFYIKPN